MRVTALRTRPSETGPRGALAAERCLSASAAVGDYLEAYDLCRAISAVVGPEGMCGAAPLDEVTATTSEDVAVAARDLIGRSHFLSSLMALLWEEAVMPMPPQPQTTATLPDPESDDSDYAFLADLPDGKVRVPQAQRRQPRARAARSRPRRAPTAAARATGPASDDAPSDPRSDIPTRRAA